MPWTERKIVDEVAAAGAGADEAFLIEAIHDITTDARIVRLINLWFDLRDVEDDEERAIRASSYLNP
jgi:hypothetical protein